MKHILDTHVVENLVKGHYLGDAFSVLGMHESVNDDGDKFVFIRSLQPQAKSVEVINKDTNASMGYMRRVHNDGLFQLD
ncbi:MAG: hypothetical protein J6V11_01605, partial [Alphaproteobacteria bacterium]|nr:hypothetical protein [Alphaproteobacteria bacterium]